MRWPWRRPEIRESAYSDVIQGALYDAALGSIGKPQPSETSTVLACCRLYSAAAFFLRRRARRSAGRCTAYSRVATR